MVDFNSNATLMTNHTQMISLEQLKTIPTPSETATHKPIAHHEFVERLLESLSFRNIIADRSQFAISQDGMKCFGVMDLTMGFSGCKFAIGLRNSNDRSLRLGLTIGFRVIVCDNLAFKGDYTPLLAKHSKNLELLDVIALGVDRMQRNFKGMETHVLALQQKSLSDTEAKMILYKAFIDGNLPLSLSLLPKVHKEYFEPLHSEFEARNLWSLHNAFTEIIKQLSPIAQMKAATQISPYLEQYL